MADLQPGVASAISPLVRRIVAPNASPMTGPGSNTYLVGVDEIVVVDPGPDHAGHVDAVVGCGGDRIRWVAVTHSHEDHAGAAAALAARTGATVLAFGAVDDGFELESTEFRLLALHTPGHSPDHVCYLLEEERMLFSGDTVIDGSTVAIVPPEGDMAAYLASLERLSSRRLRLRSIAPGHGHLIEDPAARLASYVSHRLEREAAIVAALEGGAITIDQLVDQIYADLPAGLRTAAAQTTHAHLLKLAAEGRVSGADGTWHPRAA
ncbi:MAG TPA: MBL fold metallo-hydrolase [Acidimicrobiales bacterium]|nr:MBL fold metallo-hydrolase [Acidimicrobiales bacterium]